MIEINTAFCAPKRIKTNFEPLMCGQYELDARDRGLSDPPRM
jgi:hypothetical protein